MQISTDWVCFAQDVSTADSLEGLSPEHTFCQRYGWCVNAFPTVAEVITHIRTELERLPLIEEEWSRAEVMLNIFLLSCALSDTIDDYLLGTRYSFSQAV